MRRCRFKGSTRRSKRLRRSALAVGAAAAVCCSLALSGCATQTAPPIGKDELAAARTFPYYTVYWVGPTFKGHALTAADGIEEYKPSFGDSVYYGDCMRSEGLLDSGGCVLPLQVTSTVYVLHPNFVLGTQHNAVIRGVPAAIYEEGRSIELYSGRLSIDIFSDSYKHAYEAATLLRPFNHSGSNAGSLPLPVFCPELHGRRTAALKHVMANLPGEACERAEEALAQAKALEAEGS